MINVLCDLDFLYYARYNYILPQIKKSPQEINMTKSKKENMTYVRKAHMLRNVVFFCYPKKHVSFYLTLYWEESFSIYFSLFFLFWQCKDRKPEALWSKEWWNITLGMLNANRSQKVKDYHFSNSSTELIIIWEGQFFQFLNKCEVMCDVVH